MERQQDCAARGTSPSPSPLTLRALGVGDEAEFAAAYRSTAAEGVTLGFGYRPGKAWGAYLADLDDQRTGTDLAWGSVAATTLVATVDGRIVGRTSIRHRLNAQLLADGGHIGYVVLPTFRRRGYATEILAQSLTHGHALGIDRALLTCDEDNAGSIAVIEACGGHRDLLRPCGPDMAGLARSRRYWISTAGCAILAA